MGDYLTDEMIYYTENCHITPLSENFGNDEGGPRSA